MADRLELRMAGLMRAVDDCVLQEPRLFAMLGADAPPFLASAEAHATLADRRQSAFDAAAKHYGGANQNSFHLWLVCRALSNLRHTWIDAPMPTPNTGEVVS